MRIGPELQRNIVALGDGFPQYGVKLGDQQPIALKLPLHLVDLALQLDQLNLGHDPLFGQGTADIELLARQIHTACHRPYLGIELYGLLLFLLDLLTQNIELVAQVVEALILHRLFPCRIFGKHVLITVRKNDGLLFNHHLFTPTQIGAGLDHHALDLRPQSGDVPLEGHQLLLALPKVGTETGIIDAQQWLPFLDDVPFLNEDLLDDPPLQVLDHLQLT